ncbi:MAG: PTS transporter subunit EIIC [Pikeienuella sp.]
MYIFTMTTTVAFCRVGGTGFNMPTMITAAYMSKDAGQREIGKLAIGPGLFGVNEPITFGLPVVFNAVYFIPQLIPYVISG